MSMRNRYVAGADGSVSYVTIDGDMVDQIAHGYYGNHAGHTEAVYENNPGLADRGPTLPAGLVVKLPAIQSTSETQTSGVVKLWD